jgi:hypothetical protein
VTEPDELQRLRRQLRAMASLNEQLRAQLEAATAEATSSRGPDPLDQTFSPPVGAAPRRGRRAVEWVDDLDPDTAGSSAASARDDRATPSFLVSRPDEGTFLIDGGCRRRIRSGLLAPALEQVLGERRPADDAEFASWPEGAPVEVLEGPTGAPFLVVGGRRLPVTGLPLPFPVAPEVVDRLAEGPPLDLLAGVAPRRGGDAAGWIGQLTPAAGSGPATPGHLLVGEQGVFLVEGDVRRAVSSTLLLAALEQLLGERRPAEVGELDALGDGPPVAVLEAATGAPFVVVSGKRMPLRGLPLPNPVAAVGADRLLEGPVLDLVRAIAPRRANDALGWLAPSATAGSSPASLVVDPERTTWVVEGSQRRRVGANLLVPALEQLLGPRRRVDADELAGWTEGHPVEVLEGRTGPPFVVVGGIRHPLRALPVAFPVDENGAARLAQGPTLDVLRSIAPRRAERGVGWLDQLALGAGGRPVLVAGPDNATYVIEGSVRRPVRAGLLIPVLEELLGPRRPARDEELAGDEGPGVEVLESRTGPPFVVVGGIRHPIRSLPVPVPVDEVGATRLPEGSELDVALLARQVKEARQREAERDANPDPVGELKAFVVKKRGR